MENSEEGGFVIEEKYEMKHNPNSAAVTTNAATFRNNLWPSLKPFFNGCLGAQLTVLQFQFFVWCFKDLKVHMVEKQRGPLRAAQVKKNHHMFRKSMPAQMLSGATYFAARFGSFEILTRKVEAANNGIPLAIYQEASCGLISGAIGAFIWHPFLASSPSLRQGASQRVEPLNCRKLFTALSLKARSDGLLALWKGSGSFTAYQMCITTGMLTSYNRSISYFRDSISMTEGEAQVGAGIISAFFAAVCGAPCSFVAIIKHIMQTNTSKRKHSYRDLLSYSFEVLQPGGRYKFYSGIFRSFLQKTPYTVVLWGWLEVIRQIEESDEF